MCVNVCDLSWEYNVCAIFWKLCGLNVLKYTVGNEARRSERLRINLAFGDL